MEQRFNSCAQPNKYVITTYFAILAEMNIFLPVQFAKSKVKIYVSEYPPTSAPGYM